MATITYRNASCIYPGSDKLAVDSLNLDISDGEFVVLVGPSGSGKSTALRMLAGLEDIDEGNIEIGGKDMVGVPSKDRDIAMVFQNYALYPTKTVAENMGFALKLRGVSADERRKKVEDAAKLLDLTDFLDRKPAKLSGGQRQRVAMGRAELRVALHIEQWHPVDDRTVEVGPLIHDDAHQQPAVRASNGPQLAARGYASANQVLGDGDEVVEHFLPVLTQARLVPARTVFRSAPNIAEHQHAATRNPEFAGKRAVLRTRRVLVVDRQRGRQEAAVGILNSRRIACREDRLLAHDEIWNACAVTRCGEALLDQYFGRVVGGRYGEHVFDVVRRRDVT